MDKIKFDDKIDINHGIIIDDNPQKSYTILIQLSHEKKMNVSDHECRDLTSLEASRLALNLEIIIGIRARS
jgi:hypothetical protein